MILTHVNVRLVKISKICSKFFLWKFHFKTNEKLVPPSSANKISRIYIIWLHFASNILKQFLNFLKTTIRSFFIDLHTKIACAI